MTCFYFQFTFSVSQRAFLHLMFHPIQEQTINEDDFPGKVHMKKKYIFPIADFSAIRIINWKPHQPMHDSEAEMLDSWPAKLLDFLNSYTSMCICKLKNIYINLYYCEWKKKILLNQCKTQWHSSSFVHVFYWGGNIVHYFFVSF